MELPVRIARTSTTCTCLPARMSWTSLCLAYWLKPPAKLTALDTVRTSCEGRLTAPQKLFFRLTKPAEELYDVNADPHEINNLAGNPKYASVLKEMRAVLVQWIADTKDMGVLAETEMIQRGIIANQLAEYAKRVKPLEIPLTPEKER